jgi:hypothetical protein
MTEATTPVMPECTGPSWRLAWMGLWSPLAAWAVSLAVLWASGSETVPWLVSSVVGLAIAVCGLVGLLVAVPVTLNACIAAQGRTQVSSRERLRLFLLGLVGTALGLVGFGCLTALGTLVWFFAPLKGFQTPG